MARELTAAHPAPGDPGALTAAFASDPAIWLPERSRRAGPSTWVIQLRFGAITRRVAAEIADPWHLGTTVWRTLVWRPLPQRGDPLPVQRLLPSFTGELGLRRSDVHGCSLVLDGTYKVPAARLGEATDALLLHRVASRTATGLLVDVAARLEHNAATAMLAPP